MLFCVTPLCLTEVFGTMTVEGISSNSKSESISANKDDDGNNASKLSTFDLIFKIQGWVARSKTQPIHGRLFRLNSLIRVFNICSD